MNTEIANAVNAADDKAQYDERAKRLLGHKSILAHILVDTVEEFRGMNPRDVVEYIEGEPKIGVVPTEPGLTNINGERVVGMNTENTEINEGTINFDIVFYVRMKDGLSQIMVNVEAQKDMPTEYHILNRAIFYACRLVSSQSLYVSPFYTDTSIELRTSLLPFWTSVASTDSLVKLSRMPVSNACPGFQFGLADFTAAYIADLYCPSYCSKVHVPLKRLQ